MIYTPYPGQQFYVTWYDKHQCERRSLISLKAGLTEPIFNPDQTVNIFSPNGDGINDRFFPYQSSDFSEASIEYLAEKFYIRIFNRWGVCVFESDNYSKAWDGSYKLKPCRDGVYFWLASYRGRCNGNNTVPVEQKGVVHLAR